jgi:hypothetical protein
MKFWWAVIGLTFLVSSASAGPDDGGVLLSVGLLKYDVEKEGTQIGNTKANNTYYDLKLGYLNKKIYVGGIYSVHTQESGGSQDPKRDLMGATLGYHNDGWYLDASYFFGGNYDTSTIDYRKASGFGIDLGYDVKVTGNVYLGLKGSYKSYTFKEYEQNSNTVVADNKVKSEMYPMIVLGIIF